MSTHDEDLEIKPTGSDDPQGQEPEPDAEGHSMLVYELGRTLHADRMRDAAEAAKQPRPREKPKKGGRRFLRRG